MSDVEIAVVMIVITLGVICVLSAVVGHLESCCRGYERRLRWCEKEIGLMQDRLAIVERDNEFLRYKVVDLQTSLPTVTGKIKFDSEGGFSCN